MRIATSVSSFVSVTALLSSCGGKSAAPESAGGIGGTTGDAGAQLDGSADGSNAADAFVNLFPILDASMRAGAFCFPNGACQVACTGNALTSVVGTVFDPAAKTPGMGNPVAGAIVYIPAEPLRPLPFGRSCNACASLFPQVVTYGATDAKGQFVLRDVPAGRDVPLVVQVGKWRMQYTLSQVVGCQDNTPGTTLRLPANHLEGDMPNIAVSTGGHDSLECLLRRAGVDASEFVGGAGGAGRVHVFQGGGAGQAPTTSPAAPPSASALWASLDTLLPYDLVVLSCEGAETTNANPPALFDYLSGGGRVLASHFHYSWFIGAPFSALGAVTWSAGSNDLGDIRALVPASPAGLPQPALVAMREWLSNVGALVAGELPIRSASHNADVATSSKATAWLTADPATASAPNALQCLSFDVPRGGGLESCGEVVYADFHAATGSGDYGGQSTTGVVPDGCANGPMSPQEKALEYRLFDLTSCRVLASPVPGPPQ